MSRTLATSIVHQSTAHPVTPPHLTLAASSAMSVGDPTKTPLELFTAGSRALGETGAGGVIVGGAKGGVGVGGANASAEGANATSASGVDVVGADAVGTGGTGDAGTRWEQLCPFTGCACSGGGGH
jgi:hypothetical protein